jgi:hypothetical protein
MDMVLYGLAAIMATVSLVLDLQTRRMLRRVREVNKWQ